MSRTSITLTLAAAVMALSGCATRFGHDFNGRAMLDMTPGVTTRGEALAIVGGKPQSTETLTIRKDTADKPLPQPVVVEGQYFYFRDMNAAPSSVEPEPKRHGTLFFSGDKLLFYAFSSTFRQDSTDFDATVANRLEKGKTTQADVERMLGRPTGRAIHPLARETDGTRWIYRVRWSQNNAMHSKELHIDFDRAKVVADFYLEIGKD